MSDTKDVGGQACPGTERMQDNTPYGHDVHHRGMTLRDYFAAQALAGIVSSVPREWVDGMRDGTKGGARESEAAYAWADAMLKVRRR